VFRKPARFFRMNGHKSVDLTPKLHRYINVYSANACPSNGSTQTPQAAYPLTLSLRQSDTAPKLLSVRMHTALVPWDDCASSAAAIDLSMRQADTSKWSRSG
jgi:hypothetical protein